MLTLAVLPVKSFAAAKQRLRDDLAPHLRRELAKAMLADVLDALRRASSIDQILVVTREDGARRIAAEHGAAVLDDDQHGHNAAVAIGIRHALRLEADRLLLIPGDCPLLRPVEVDALLARRASARSALIVPDRHGTGTNALLLTPPDSLMPSFGPGSRRRHASDAHVAGVPHAVVEVNSLALDIDTPDDLATLEATLATSDGGAAHTRDALSRVALSGARRPTATRC